MNQGGGIKKFTDLHAWQEAHAVVLDIYTHSKSFPSDERFGLTNQIRRAAISISSNIAEGFSRRSYKEKIQFYFIALGSTTEVQNQLLIAKDVGYIQKDSFDTIAQKTIVVHKLINGLIKSSRTHIHTS